MNERIGHCPKCGHHVNFALSNRIAYCPLCDEYFKPEDCK